MIEIKDINGNSVLKLYSTEDDKQQSADAVALGSGSVWVRELGGKDCIRLKFSLDRPLHIGIGYHIETESYGRFTMTSDYSPEYNAATGGYDYEVAFDAWYHSWNRYLFMLHPHHGARETSFNLTDRIMGHISLLEENIEQRFGPEAVEELFIEIQPSVSTEKAVNVTYDSLHIVDAISAMAEAFECEWWMQDGNHLCFGRCERDNDPMEWTAGRNAASITPSGSSGAYATRLYVFGGTANIPKRYRKKLVLAATEIDAANGRFRDANRKLYPSVFAASVKDENRVTTTAAWGGVSHQVRLNPDNAGAAKDEASWIYCDAIPAKGTSFTIEGVLLGRVDASYFTSDYGEDSAIAGWEQRLMMPADSAPGNHIDSASIKGADGKTIEEMVVEQVVVFDDVYPHKRTRISRVDSYTTETEDQSDENGNAPVTVTHYRLMVEKGDFEFSEDYLLSGQTLRCTFMTGKMAGMSFDLKFGGDVNGTSMQEYEVINSEDYGVLLPNTQLYPSEGDEMVLTGYDVSYLSADGNSLIASAEEELERKGREYQSKLEKNKATYTVKLEPQYAADEGTIVYLGSKVTLRQATGELIATSRVIAMEVKLDIPYDTPVYTVGESRQYSRLSEIEGKVSTVQSQLVMGGAAGTGSGVEIITSDSGRKPTDSNVYSALASDNRFLSKTRDDTAKGRITFSKGADFGQFVSGIVGGAGGRIDPKGNAELESLVLRSFLEVPELRFNRIDVVSGELWNSIAFGTISSVTIDANGTGGTAWVHLEETERCGLKVGDICRGIYSDFGDGRPADEDDDSNGFKKTYGFSTAYFTPTSIIKNEEGEFGFNYQIQPGTKVHPCAYMKFAVYGSFTDPSRRASAYFTRSYMRYLKNVQTWQIDPDRNIASQFGNLDGLTIGGMQMKGEGTFLSNIFMTGAIIQFTPEQKEELKGQDAYSVVLSDYECVIHVNSDGNVRDMTKVRQVVATDGNVMAMKDGKPVSVVDLGYNATAAVQVHKGQTLMHHAPMVGALAYTIVPVFSNCEGFVANGVLIVTRIIDVEAGAYVDLEINCEGNAVFSKHYAISVVHDAADSFTQFVFKRTNDDEVAKPEGGSYASPLPDGWSDGVPAGEAKLWMSRRKFTSDGKNQDDDWSTPRPMSDTADFDVCFHDAVAGDAAPSAPPKDMHPTQTGMSGNNGWYDDGKTTSEWMAMATCSNGVWSDWSVVKIVGESPVIADIDNEMDGIGVGSDGILDVATSTSTNVCMYHGSRLMQIRSVSVSGLPSGVTASTAYPSSSDHSRCTVTFNISSGTDFSTTNRYAITLTIVATYNDVDYTRTLTYTLLGTTNGKDGEVYYLQPSTTAVKRNKDLVYSPSSVTCARYVKKGTSDAVASSEGELTMSTDGGSTWDAYKSVSNFNGVSSIIYRWKLNGVEIDRETVPVVIDGADGRGIKTTIDMFCALSSDKEAYAIQYGDWKTFDEARTSWNVNNPYLWKRTEIVYDVGEPEYKYSINSIYEKGDNGAPLIPLRWEDLAIGDKVYSGNNGEITTNIVLYNELWYRCMVTHTIKTGETPDNDSGKWELMSNFKNVATEIFFATLAYIKNLLLNNAKAGYQNGNTFVPTIEFNEKGEVTLYGVGSNSAKKTVKITSDGIKVSQVGGAEKDSLLIDWNGLMYGGSDAASGRFQDGMIFLRQLVNDPNHPENMVRELTINTEDITLSSQFYYGNAKWSEVLDAAKSTKIVVCEGSLPSTTVANTLYVVI